MVHLRIVAPPVTPEDFSSADHDLSSTISNPDFMAFFVAFLREVAGVLRRRRSRGR